MYQGSETGAAKAKRFIRAANRVLDLALSHSERGPARREAGWKLLTRASHLDPWPVCWYVRKPAQLLPKLVKTPVAEMKALKAVRAARKVYDGIYFSKRKESANANEILLDAVEHYCAVCGMEYKRPARVA